MTIVRKYALFALNLALHGFHLVLIVFNLVGWMFCETRMLNLVVLLLTLLSWYGLGPLMGKGSAWGYCVVTDLQWGVRRQMGLDSRKGGYIKYLADNLLGDDFDETRVDKWSTVVFLTCIFASVTTNLVYGSCSIFIY
ncbi:MAG: DUF2784 family protein [Gammaproteobacteria bacterium]|nr:DUF2784 family protein [Gammaproteobacteria bacterium]